MTIRDPSYEMIKTHVFSNKGRSLIRDVSFLLSGDTAHPVYCCSFHHVGFLFCKIGLSLFLSRGILAADDSTTKRNRVSLVGSHWHDRSVVCLAASGSSKAETLLRCSRFVGECISFSLNQLELAEHPQPTRL